MIALITSCINPFKEHHILPKSYFTVEERLHQTINTAQKLEGFAFSRIYLLDNSDKFDFTPFMDTFDDRLIIRHFQQYQFKNKGINELLLLLSVLKELPEEEEIFKISGRYYPNGNFICNLNAGADFKFKDYNLYSKKGTVSTRGYFVKDKHIYERFLLECMTEVFSYPKRIVGLRSALDAVKQMIRPEFSRESNTSIELAAARVVKGGAYVVQQTETIGIEGQIAGFENRDFIQE